MFPLSQVMRPAAVLTVGCLVACTTTATINTIPPGAQVYLRGTYVGKSPVTVELKDGFDDATYYARIEMPGYRTQEIKLEDHYSGWIALDILLAVPTLGLSYYLFLLHGRRHASEYSFQLLPRTPEEEARATQAPTLPAPPAPAAETSTASPQAIALDRLRLETGCDARQIKTVSQSSAAGGEVAYRMEACGAAYVCSVSRARATCKPALRSPAPRP